MIILISVHIIFITVSSVLVMSDVDLITAYSPCPQSHERN